MSLHKDEDLESISKLLDSHGIVFENSLKKRLFIKKNLRNPEPLKVRRIVEYYRGNPVKFIASRVILNGHKFDDHGKACNAVNHYLQKLQNLELTGMESKKYMYTRRNYNPDARTVIVVDADSYNGNHDKFIEEFEGEVYFFSNNENALPVLDSKIGIMNVLCETYSQAVDYRILFYCFRIFHAKTEIIIISNDKFLRGLVNFDALQGQIKVL